MREDAYPVTWKVVACATLAMGAGILHLGLAPSHLAEARGQGIFFIALGVAQVGWGAAFLRNATPRTYILGFMATLVMPAALYVLTRFIPAPFSSEAEAFDTIGVATLAFEVLGALALAAHGVSSQIGWRNPTISPTALVVLLVVAGAGTAGALQGVGMLAEPVAPWLAEGESSEHHSTASPEAEEDGHGAHASAAPTPVEVPIFSGVAPTPWPGPQGSR